MANIKIEPSGSALFSVRMSKFKAALLWFVLLPVVVISTLELLSMTPDAGIYNNNRLAILHLILQYFGAESVLVLAFKLFCVVFFALFIFVAPFFIFRDRYMLVYEKNGIKAVGVLEGRLIRWTDIDDAFVLRHRFGTFIEIQLKNKSTSRTLLARLFGKDNSRIKISLSLGDKTIGEAFRVLQDIRRHLKETNTNLGDITIEGIVPTYRNNIKSLSICRWLIRLIFWPLIGFYSVYGATYLFASSSDIQSGNVSYLESNALDTVFIALVTCAMFSFLFFVYRSSQNAQILSPQSDVEKPLTCVIQYFVPIWFFYKPYTSMKRIWNSSCDYTAPRVILVWWLAYWLFYIIGEEIISIYYDPFSTSVTNPEYAQTIFGIFQLTSALSVYLARRMANRVMDVQEYGRVAYG